MSHFGKTTLTTLLSTSSTYADPVGKISLEATSVPASWYHQKVKVLPGTPTSPSIVLDLSANYLAMTPQSICVANKGEADVTVEMWNKVGDLPHPSAGITFSGDEIVDESGGSTYFEDVRVGDVIYSSNAGNATNRKFFLVVEHPAGYPQKVNVSLEGTTLATQVADDTASFLHLTRNVFKIAAGGFIHLPGNVADVDLQSITGSSAIGAQFNEFKLYTKDLNTEVEIFIIGT